jgi:hypothetical protein
VLFPNERVGIRACPSVGCRSRARAPLEECWWEPPRRSHTHSLTFSLFDVPCDLGN